MFFVFISSSLSPPLHFASPHLNRCHIFRLYLTVYCCWSLSSSKTNFFSCTVLFFITGGPATGGLLSFGCPASSSDFFFCRLRLSVCCVCLCRCCCRLCVQQTNKQCVPFPPLPLRIRLLLLHLLHHSFSISIGHVEEREKR